MNSKYLIEFIYSPSVKFSSFIREYSSALCRDGTETNGCPYISIASDELKSLVIYT